MSAINLTSLYKTPCVQSLNVLKQVLLIFYEALRTENSTRLDSSMLNPQSIRVDSKFNEN